MSHPTFETIATTLEPFTEQDFINGSVEAINSPDASVFVLWPHGDETLGGRLGHHLYSERPDILESVDYLCGNPPAASQTPAVRDTGGWDLNRAYGANVPTDSYEYARAQFIKEQIAEHDYKYILDMHTTRAEQEDCLILSTEFREEKSMQALIAASPVKHIVVFPPHIARQGLIGHYANSVSVEYNRELADERGVPDAVVMLEGLLRGKPVHEPFEREFYYVEDTIAHDMDLGDDPRNFRPTAKGIIPIMFGENTYRNDPNKNYVGFYATRQELIIV
jgi:succinylglutamate desuccinylase